MGKTEGIEARLAGLGLRLPEPQRFGSPNRTAAVLVGELLFVSGHPPAALPGVRTQGKVGEDVTEEEAYEAARACALNVLATARAAVGSLERVERVVKMLGFVNSAPGFTRQSAVIDGASDLYLELFGPDRVSARSAVGAAELPNGLSVEIEAIFKISA